jgi:hypothetical protein
MDRNQIIEYGKLRTNTIAQIKVYICWDTLKWYNKIYLYIRYKPFDWFKRIKIRYGNEIMTFRNGKLIKTLKDEIVRGKRASLRVVDDWSGIDSEVVSEVLKEFK